MLPYQMIAGGKFTLSTATIASGLELEVPSQSPTDYVVMRALTRWGETTDAQAIEWSWEKSLSQGAARGILQDDDGTTPIMSAVFLASNGISTYDTSNPPVFAALATSGTDVDKTTYVVTMANTGSIAVGDWVRLYGTTSMLQVAGYSFQVTAVTANTNITLGYMASGGQVMAADATAGSVLKFIPNRMYPRWQFVANISQATQAVISFTGKNDYTPGEFISLRVPSDFGMDEINNKAVRVLSVTNSGTVSSVTVDHDTSGYTTFAFPTSADAAVGVSPAVAVPSSSGVVPEAGSATVPQEPPGTNLRDAFDNRNKRVVRLLPGLFNVLGSESHDGDVWMWQAYSYDKYSSVT